MSTAAKRRRKPKERKISSAEDNLRKNLASSNKIDSPDDSLGLYNWLRNLHALKDDHRSQWEKDLEETLRQELGIDA